MEKMECLTLTVNDKWLTLTVVIWPLVNLFDSKFSSLTSTLWCSTTISEETKPFIVTLWSCIRSCSSTSWECSTLYFKICACVGWFKMIFNYKIILFNRCFLHRLPRATSCHQIPQQIGKWWMKKGVSTQQWHNNTMMEFSHLGQY